MRHAEFQLDVGISDTDSDRQSVLTISLGDKEIAKNCDNGRKMKKKKNNSIE